MDKEELLSRYEREKEELGNENLALQRERDDSLLMAENDKQQCLSILEQEKSTLTEKLGGVQRILADQQAEYERLKRDFMAKEEQDRNTINTVQSELKKFRTQFEEAT